MRLLLLGATEGLRYRLADMIANDMPGSELNYRNYGDAAPTPQEQRSNDVILCSIGRGGEHLEDMREVFLTSRNCAVTAPIIALAEGHESTLAGQALLAGADRVLPLPGLSAEMLGTNLKLAHAQKMRIESGSAGEDKLPNVPGYLVRRKIGEGGMSKVYLAQADGQASPVVLKVVDAQLLRDESFVLRFARECELLARIRHENVVKIFDFSIDTRRPFLAMEYFACGDLKSRIRGGLPAIAALKIMMQIAKAIDAVHSAGLVHRDLKPHNIMFRDKDQLALVDFGLAKPIDPNTTAQMQLTQDGMILATPIYMSPEQCLGREHGPRGDLYSCGVILFEMLSGAPPFSGNDPAALAYQHVNAEVPKLPQRVAGFQGVVDRLLAKNPEDRFQSAKELFAHIAI